MMLLALAPGWLALSDAAIHGYKGDLFTDAGYGAFVFRGGREGMFASSGQVTAARVFFPSERGRTVKGLCLNAP